MVDLILAGLIRISWMDFMETWEDKEWAKEKQRKCRCRSWIKSRNLTLNRPSRARGALTGRRHRNGAGMRVKGIWMFVTQTSGREHLHFRTFFPGVAHLSTLPPLKLFGFKWSCSIEVCSDFLFSVSPSCSCSVELRVPVRHVFTYWFLVLDCCFCVSCLLDFVLLSVLASIKKVCRKSSGKKGLPKYCKKNKDCFLT